MGEYAVTIPGEPGIGVAAPPRATASYTPGGAGGLSVVFRFGKVEQRMGWHPLEPLPVASSNAQLGNPAGTDSGTTGDPLASVDSAIRASGMNHPTETVGGELVVDTRSFYAGERKLGLGSSAASVLLLTASAYILGGVVDGRETPGPEERKRIAAAAVQAHRVFQGGRGSGYDVLVSAYGGWIQLLGGPVPQATPLTLPVASVPPAQQVSAGPQRPSAPKNRAAFPVWALFSGPAAVRTGSAIDAFRRFAEADPVAYSEYLAANRRLCSAFTVGDADARLAALREAAELGRKLGSAIGVPADPGPEPGPATESVGGVRKALGAGNELIAWFGMPGTSPPGASLIQCTQAEPVTGLEVIWS